MIFLKKYWRLIALVAGFISLTLIGLIARSKGFKLPFEIPPPPDLKTEMRAIKAEAEVEKVKAKMGHSEALAKVAEEHKAALLQLDEAQATQARELQKDPAKLAAFLVRAGK